MALTAATAVSAGTIVAATLAATGVVAASAAVVGTAASAMHDAVPVSRPPSDTGDGLATTSGAAACKPARLDKAPNATPIAPELAVSKAA